VKQDILWSGSFREIHPKTHLGETISEGVFMNLNLKNVGTCDHNYQRKIL
jgi:hypothetical protein